MHLAQVWRWSCLWWDGLIWGSSHVVFQSRWNTNKAYDIYCITDQNYKLILDFHHCYYWSTCCLLQVLSAHQTNLSYIKPLPSYLHPKLTLGWASSILVSPRVPLLYGIYESYSFSSTGHQIDHCYIENQTLWCSNIAANTKSVETTTTDTESLDLYFWLPHSL